MTKLVAEVNDEQSMYLPLEEEEEDSIEVTITLIFWLTVHPNILL
jgi:hypothetical protein